MLGRETVNCVKGGDCKKKEGCGVTRGEIGCKIASPMAIKKTGDTIKFLLLKGSQKLFEEGRGNQEGLEKVSKHGLFTNLLVKARCKKSFLPCLQEGGVMGKRGLRLHGKPTVTGQSVGIGGIRWVRWSRYGAKKITCVGGGEERTFCLQKMRIYYNPYPWIFDSNPRIGG